MVLRVGWAAEGVVLIFWWRRAAGGMMLMVLSGRTAFGTIVVTALGTMAIR